MKPHVGRVSIRSNYYTCVQGDESSIESVCNALWENSFSPHIFKKLKGTRAKGVAIAVTKDMLAHAVDSHYDVAVLVAGDADYVPLVEEVKRRGKRVFVVYFSEQYGLSPKLRLAADRFIDITELFEANWKAFKQQ